MIKLILMALVIMNLFACQKELSLQQQTTSEPNRINAQKQALYNEKTVSLLPNLPCLEQYISGVWVKEHIYDGQNNLITSDSLHWGIHSNDTLHFSSIPHPWMTNSQGINTLYHSVQIPSHAYGNVYQVQTRNCQLNMGMMSCGIAWFGYNVVTLTTNELVLEYIYSPAQNDPNMWFMSATVAEAHRIHYRKIP